jgi:hypothetical protein
MSTWPRTRHQAAGGSENTVGPHSFKINKDNAIDVALAKGSCGSDDDAGGGGDDDDNDDDDDDDDEDDDADDNDEKQSEPLQIVIHDRLATSHTS